MSTIVAKTNETPIVLSRGIYDLLKAYIQKKRLSRHNELKLEEELKSAKQIVRRNIPEKIVDLNKRVRIKELDSEQEFEYNLVAPQKAKRKNNTLSILSPIGVALLGYEEGAELSWEMPEGIKSYKILEVSPLVK